MIKGLDIINGVKISKDINLLHMSLVRLFFTPIGSQIGALDYGSRIPDYLYEDASEVNVLAILTEAKDLIVNYEPRIVLNAISAEIKPTTNNGSKELIINIEFDWVNEEGSGQSNSIQITNT
jgi:phage baseplate assembly protein W